MATRADTALPARRAAASALLGSTVEYYDFTLYATAAALFLGPIFFKPLAGTANTMASFITFGVAFVARPVGAIAFGHLGDRVGRREALTWSVLMMGLSTFCIGLLPSYASIGMTAPVLLVALRLVQGLSAGAEQPGSNALTLENAAPGARGRLAAWTMQGTALGTLAGKVAFIWVTALPHDQLMAWGWRIPFLAAGPLLVVAWWIRRRAIEAPVFQATLATRPVRVPLAVALRRHWLSVFLVAGGTLMMAGGAALNVFGLQVATKIGGVTERTFLVILAVATALELVVQPLWARLGDKVGRRPVVVVALALAAGLFFVYLPALVHGSIPTMLGAVVAMTVAWSGANAVSAAFFAEQFPTNIRFTGMALGSQLGMILVGFSPTFMMTVLGKGGHPWVPAATVGALFMLAAAVSCLFARETGALSMSELDNNEGQAYEKHRPIRQVSQITAEDGRAGSVAKRHRSVLR